MRRAGFFTLILLAAFLPSCGNGTSDTPTTPTTPSAPAQPAAVTATVTVVNANAGAPAGHSEAPRITEHINVTDVFVFAPPPAVGGQLGTLRHSITLANGDVLFQDADPSPNVFDAGTTGTFDVTLIYERDVALGAGGQVVSVGVSAPLSDALSNQSTITSPFVSVPPDFVDIVDILDCQPDTTTACLDDERFKVEVDWRSATTTGQGMVTNTNPSINGVDFLLDGNAGFDMFVQLLDKCGQDNRFWVFFAATTNVEFTLTVTDTNTGEHKEYFNPLGNANPAVTDTNAFATCPGPVPVP